MNDKLFSEKVYFLQRTEGIDVKRESSFFIRDFGYSGEDEVGMEFVPCPDIQ
ncbi:MAG: hypothetical protein Q4B67_07405 [Eubacteriales bacterium]|nr:hypothetical protein [Eubacteriales bacterium]